MNHICPKCNQKALSLAAINYKEPEKYSLPFFSLIIIGGFLVILISVYPKLFANLSTVSTANLSSDTTELNFIDFSAISLFVALIFALFFFYKAYQNYTREIELNETIFLEKKERYHQLSYCEDCNIIFDNDGIFENADDEGFMKMMSVVTKKEEKENPHMG